MLGSRRALVQPEAKFLRLRKKPDIKLTTDLTAHGPTHMIIIQIIIYCIQFVIDCSFLSLCHHLCVCVSPRSQGEFVSVMPLFGKSHKSPADIVRTLKENLAILVKQDKKTDKVENV